MDGSVIQEFTRPVEAMTLTECGSEIERLDRALARLAEGRSEGSPETLQARRRQLLDALQLRQPQSREDALAKFRWVLYESRDEPRLDPAATDHLVFVMKQVAAFPAKSIH